MKKVNENLYTQLETAIYGELLKAVQSYSKNIKRNLKVNKLN